MKKKRKNRKVEKKSNFVKTNWKKRKKNEKKMKKREKLEKKKKEKSTVDYCCNPYCFVCGGTVIPPHHLEYVVILKMFD